VSLVAALSGAVLGFLQVFAEARGDKRSLLLHRPLSPSRIFLAKVLAGVSLYLVALLAPFLCAVGLAATPGHVAAPFEWRMALPWLADLLTGLVYYFAGMISAQREARWYGSQFLPLAAGLFTSLLVWNATEFWQALVAIGMMGALVAVAAWGSVVSGGAYTRQYWPAQIACPACRRRRVVTREQCEHCGAPHAYPALDGTEIFEADNVADTVTCQPVPLR
jgi:hypothetical protein